MLVATNRVMAEFDSGSLGADEFSHTIGNLDVPWKVGIQSNRFNGRVRSREFADCTLGEMRFEACTGVRDQSEIARKDSGYICLSYLRNGNMTFSQGGRDIMVERGDMLLWDATTPSMFTTLGASQFELIWLPMHLVEHRVGPIKASLGHCLPGGKGIGLLLAQHFQNLHKMIDDMSLTAQRRVVEASIDLIFACFSHDGELLDELSAHQGELLAAAKAMIAANVDIGTFSPRTVAKRLGISVRYLQKLFAARGETFSSYVAQQRLAYARKLLANGGLNCLSLTEVAHQSGYCDLSHLNRSFKRRFGMSPSAYRASS